MEEVLKILVKYTLRDIRDYSFTLSFSKPLYKILLIFAGLFTASWLLAVLAVIVIPAEAKAEYILIVLLAMIPFLLFFAISLLPFILSYIAQSSNFRKAKLLREPQFMEIGEEGIRISSPSGSFSAGWDDIYRVRELRPCFLIMTSPGKNILLPRRCFRDKTQLDAFLGLVTSALPKNKLKIKRYKLGKVSPDFDPFEYGNAAQAGTELDTEDNINQGMPEDEHQLFDLSLVLTQNDLVKTNLIYYYTKPAGIIVNVIGIIFLAFSIIGLARHTSGFLTLLFGAWLIVITPIMLYFNTTKRYKKDAALQKPFIYRLYKDYYIVDHPSGVSRIRWSDLVKIVETRNSYLLYTSTRIAHVIPKRTLGGDEAKNEFLRGLARNKTRRSGTSLPQ